MIFFNGSGRRGAAGGEGGRQFYKKSKLQDKFTLIYFSWIFHGFFMDFS
jgi:hypothetical protein